MWRYLIVTAIDITNEKFGRLLAIRPTDKRSGTSIVWECMCECGEIVFINSNNLRRGKSKSCGCYRDEFAITHGLSGSRIYKLWNAMFSRVRYPERYENHAGRGIGSCPEWFVFENFYTDMGDSYTEQASLDRIDVNGDYCKDNCRWTTGSVQNFNKRMDARNTSGKTGVRFHEPTGKWEAKIQKEGKSIWLGRFDDFDSAVEARKLAELKYFGFTKD